MILNMVLAMRSAMYPKIVVIGNEMYAFCRRTYAPSNLFLLKSCFVDLTDLY